MDAVTYNAMQTNGTVAKAVIRNLVERIAAGGVQAEMFPGNQLSVTPPIPKFRTNLVYI